MAKLLKLRRGTTTQHASFTGAEGEVTIDTTKDTTVVHDGSTAGGTPLAKEDMSNVSSASIAGRLGTDSIATTKIAGGALPSDVTIASINIVDGSIVNSDLNSGANITSGKLATTGVSAGSYGSSSAIPIVTVNAQGQVTAASTTAIDSTRIDNGTSNVRVANNGSTNVSHSGTDRLSVTNSGVDVTGNISVSGTVDGVDVAALKTSKDSLSTTNGALVNGVTATTQAQSDNSTKVSTTAFVKTAVADLVDSSPGALDTLNELAAAINDDANFSTTVNNNIATKMPKSGGEFTGSIICENITPDGDSDRNLGNNTTRFEGVYADNFYGSGANLTGIEAFVTGMILLWSGAANAIPSGFVLCNGSNSTPDLRNRFVIGAGDTYAVDATGGSSTISGNVTHSHSTPNHTHGLNGHTHSTPNHSHGVNSHSHSTPNHSHSVNNHTHSISGSVSGNTNNTGGHSHSFLAGQPDQQTNNTSGPLRQVLGAQFANVNTNSAGNHNHSFSGSFSGNSGNSAPNTNNSGGGNTGNAGANTNNSGGSNSGAANGSTTSAGGSNTGNSGSGSTVSVLNPYYALCYIMKT